MTSLRRILTSELGPLARRERVAARVGGEPLRATLDLIRGRLTDFSRGTDPGASIELRAALPRLLETILTSKRPLALAARAIRRGDLSVERA